MGSRVTPGVYARAASPARYRGGVSVTRAHFILYVRDQAASAAFYRAALAVDPTLDVPGMTEFAVAGAVLGLMPAAGARRLLGIGVGEQVPRAELYFQVDDATAFHRRALAAGAQELSPGQARDWGDFAAYSLDPDGHVLAFATPIRTPHTPPAPSPRA